MSKSKIQSLEFINKTNAAMNNLIVLLKDFFKGDNFSNTVKYIFNRTFRINDSQNFILNSNLFKQNIKSNIEQQGGKKRRFNNTKKYLKNITKTKSTKNKTKSKK